MVVLTFQLHVAAGEFPESSDTIFWQAAVY